MKSNSRNLTMLNVALLFVSAIMGAGFASGREIWQFFGVFGKKGLFGAVLVAVVFIVTGGMTAYLARHFKTCDMGKIIVPGNHKKMTEIVGYFMAVMLFTVLITMTAAGGALFHQQVGLPIPIGGIIILLLVLATVLGDFQRISKVFKYVMPVLFIAVIGISMLVNLWHFKEPPMEGELLPSPAAENWFLAAWLYISYNMLAIIPFVATAAINAKSNKSAILGSSLGGGFLGAMAIVIVLALQKDTTYSQSLDLPMLGYATRISGIIGNIYMMLLFSAIYSSATSNFYGCTTKIKKSKRKNLTIIILAVFAYLLGLLGFKNIVSYMFPLEGYLGFAIIAMLTVNFFQIVKRNTRAQA